METDWIPILDLIKNSKFESSIIATFNSYLPFYEEVVLRKLFSTGCRHNLLMMDAGQFHESLMAPTLRPFSAGYDYTLIPIKSNGAYHPKIIFLFGRKKGLLFVGSHNMTISGLGLNQELTTKIEISDGKEKKGIQIAQDVWSFIKTWLEFQAGEIPTEIFNAFNLISSHVPWLTSKTESEKSDFTFLGSLPVGTSLWSKLREKISGPMKRVTAVGPFFDEKFGFLDELNKGLSPNEVIVGIEPNTVHIPIKVEKIENVRFVDTSGVFKNKGYLHAKMLYFESEIGENWLVTGSANPSTPAWTSPLAKRNAEAIILHQNPTASLTANELGITKLKELAAIQEDVFHNIRERISKLKDQNSKKSSKTSSFIALSDGENIILKNHRLENFEFLKADCLDEYNEIAY